MNVKIQQQVLGGEVTRFHTYPLNPRQNVAQHSWGVAMLVQRLLPNCRKELVLAALTHDLAEHVVGDVPAPVKWKHPEFHQHLNELEEKVQRNLGIPDYNLTQEEKLVLKLADILELTIWAQYCLIAHGSLAATLVINNGARHAHKLLEEAQLDGPEDWSQDIRKRSYEILAEVGEWQNLTAHVW